MGKRVEADSSPVSFFGPELLLPGHHYVTLPPFGARRILVSAPSRFERRKLAKSAISWGRTHSGARRAVGRAAAAVSAEWCLLSPGNRPRVNPAWSDSTLGCRLRSFIEEAASAVVLTQSEAERRTHGRRVRGVVTGSWGSVFIKAVDSQKNAARLANEARIMRLVGRAAAPELLHEYIEPTAGFIVTEAVQPDYRRQSLTPDPQAIGLLESLPLQGEAAAEHHPWITGVVTPGCPSDVVRWSEMLRSRLWPVVVSHGDFGPAHLATRQGGGSVLIDWEYGSMDGFPGVDAANWVIRVGADSAYASPEAITAVFTSWACGRECGGIRMTPDEARAILALTAYWYRHWGGAERSLSLRTSLWVRAAS